MQRACIVFYAVYVHVHVDILCPFDTRGEALESVCTSTHVSCLSTYVTKVIAFLGLCSIDTRLSWIIRYDILLDVEMRYHVEEWKHSNCSDELLFHRTCTRKQGTFIEHNVLEQNSTMG